MDRENLRTAVPKAKESDTTEPLNKQTEHFFTEYHKKFNFYNFHLLVND